MESFTSFSRLSCLSSECLRWPKAGSWYRNLQENMSRSVSRSGHGQELVLVAGGFPQSEGRSSAKAEHSHPCCPPAA